MERGKVISPFADIEAVAPSKSGKSRHLGFLIGLGILLLAGGLIGGVAVARYLNDPYRTLEEFPVAQYLDNYRSLAGSKFKAELKVEADLGWKEGMGRLMLFSVKSDNRPLAVLVPAGVAKDIYFTKGQMYMAGLEVKEGGLIHANSCRKN